MFEKAKVEIEGDDFREGLELQLFLLKFPSPSLKDKQKPSSVTMK